MKVAASGARRVGLRSDGTLVATGDDHSRKYKVGNRDLK
jgi:hypothetical protein